MESSGRVAISHTGAYPSREGREPDDVRRDVGVLDFEALASDIADVAALSVAWTRLSVCWRLLAGKLAGMMRAMEALIKSVVLVGCRPNLPTRPRRRPRKLSVDRDTER